MNTQVTLFAVLALAQVLSVAGGCHDKVATKSCQYFARIGGCSWKSVKPNCALTCKYCVPKPKCATLASKYGCCWDGKTEAKGYLEEGCPDCKDRFPSWCRTRVSGHAKEKACNAQGKKYCPKSCGVCSVRAAAQARPDCLYSPYGCCWDLTPAKGLNGEGCKVCENVYYRLCPMWNDYCEPEALRIVGRDIVERYRESCPVTCGKCKKGQKKLDLSVYRRH